MSRLLQMGSTSPFRRYLELMGIHPVQMIGTCPWLYLMGGRIKTKVSPPISNSMPWHDLRLSLRCPATAGKPALTFDAVFNSSLKSRALKDDEFKTYIIGESQQYIHLILLHSYLWRSCRTRSPTH